MSKEKRYKWINGDTLFDSDQVYDNKTGNKTQPVYVTDLLNEQDQKIADLEAKLAEKEKEKEIEELKHFKVTIGTIENNQVDISSTTYTDQDKISFCIEQLEKVKEFVNDFYGEYSASVITNFIDNQINELKEGK